MLGRWVRHLLWRPYELACQKHPIVPLRAEVTRPVEGVIGLRIGNVVTRVLGGFGGYDYSVSYLVDGALLIDSGFPWAGRCLRETLVELGADKTLRTVVNTHEHEDHTGNNALLADWLRAEIYAHRNAIPEIRFPSELAWYRRFLFGPTASVEVRPVPESLDAGRFAFEAHHMPGHCPGHIVLFEPERRWLFSGDLYIAADLDSQLADADGPSWIASLERAIALRPAALFDGHGVVVLGEDEVLALLARKRDFLLEIRRRVFEAAEKAATLREVTRRVFDRRDWVDRLSLGDGWMSLITGSDFSRGNVVKSFLRAPDAPAALASHEPTRAGPRH